MKTVHYLCRNANLLNVLLLAGLIVLLLYVVRPLLRPGVPYKLPSVKQKVIVQGEAAGENAPPAPSPLDYAAISDNNLFHPERRIPPEKKELPRPELVLYGTVISDGMTIAYIEDKKSPKTTPGRGKRQTVVKKGDVLSGFTLKEIQVDRITLTRGEETMVVRLAETGKRRGDEGPNAAKSPLAAVASPSAVASAVAVKPAQQPVLSGRPAVQAPDGAPFIRRGLRPGSRDPRREVQ